MEFSRWYQLFAGCLKSNFLGINWLFLLSDFTRGALKLSLVFFCETKTFYCLESSKPTLWMVTQLIAERCFSGFWGFFLRIHNSKCQRQTAINFGYQQLTEILILQCGYWWSNFCFRLVLNNLSYLWRQQQVVPSMYETLYDAFSKQSSIHRLCHHQRHPENTEHWTEIHKKLFRTCVHAGWMWQFWCKLHLCGMSFGTSISRDFIWRILMLPSIPLAVTTSQAKSYIVLESSQAYTSAAPAFLAHILNRENQEVKTMTDTHYNTGPTLAAAKEHTEHGFGLIRIKF